MDLMTRNLGFDVICCTENYGQLIAFRSNDALESIFFKIPMLFEEGKSSPLLSQYQTLPSEVLPTNKQS